MILFNWNNGKTHKQKVLNHLKKKGTITSMQAIKKYGNTRLGEYIRQLRAEGYNIETVKTSAPNRYGKTTYFAVYELKE